MSILATRLRALRRITGLHPRIQVRNNTNASGESTPASEPVPASNPIVHDPIKSFSEITANMLKSSKEFEKGISSDMERPSILNVKLRYQNLSEKFDLGDAIMVGSSVYAVVQMPQSFKDPLIVCGPNGVTSEVWPAMISAKLCNLVPKTSNLFNNPLNEDKTAVSGSLYRMVGFPLGSLQNEALELARKLVPLVVDLLLLCQKEDTSVVMSLYDFISLVQRHKNSDLESLTGFNLPILPDETEAEITPTFLLALTMSFDDYLVRNKIRLEFGYNKKSILIINSRNLEEVFVSILTKNTNKRRSPKIPEIFPEYVKHYGLDNLSTTNPQSDGIALILLRNTSTYGDLTLNKSHALAYAHRFNLLDTKGTHRDRSAFKWIFNPDSHVNRAKEALIPVVNKGQDKLKDIRTPVAETVYCIDSDDTTEVDDGISIKVEKDIAHVEVHIANPTSAFEDSAPLIESVYSRSTTVYLPEGKIPMLPSEFADKFSLRDGAPALTIAMDFDMKTGERLRYKVKASTLKSVKSINYNNVEKLLEAGDNHDLNSLYRLSSLFQEKRKRNGATMNFIAQNDLRVWAKGEGVVLERNFTPKATQLVSELMLQANASVGEFAHSHHIPCIFRFNTLNFYTPKQREQFFRQSVIGFDWMPAMRPSTEDTIPKKHEATGLPMYTWFTSPLRRAQDLLLHFQLEAYLLGQKSPLSLEKLNNMIPWISASQSLVKLFQRHMERFYILKYLEKRGIGKRVAGVLARTYDDGTQQVYLPEYNVFASLENDSLTSNGESSFSIESVDHMCDSLVVKKVASNSKL